LVSKLKEALRLKEKEFEYTLSITRIAKEVKNNKQRVDM
jgi:hypothetical protein